MSYLISCVHITLKYNTLNDPCSKNLLKETKTQCSLYIWWYIEIEIFQFIRNFHVKNDILEMIKINGDMVSTAWISYKKMPVY